MWYIHYIVEITCYDDEINQVNAILMCAKNDVISVAFVAIAQVRIVSEI